MRKIIALKPDKPKYSEQELKAQIAEVVKGLSKNNLVSLRPMV